MLHTPLSEDASARRFRLAAGLRACGRTYADYPGYMRALLRIKKACALANAATGKLDNARCRAIVRACDAIKEGAFPSPDALVDAAPLLDELLNAAIAAEASQGPGAPEVDPDRHVALSHTPQEAVACADGLFIRERLEAVLAALPGLEDALQAKGEAFRTVIRMGRETLRDALTISLGALFDAYAAEVRGVRERLAEERARWDSCALGASCPGTAGAAFREEAAARLSALCGVTLRPRAAAAVADTVMAHAHLEAVGLTAGRIARDLILMTSGPHCGFGDVCIPAAQPGSSIMPGKVNPVIPDMIAQMGYRVSANHAGIAFAAYGSGLEKGCDAAMIRRAFHESAEMLSKGLPLFVAKVIEGTEAGPSLDARALRVAWRPYHLAVRRLFGEEAAERVFRRARERGIPYADALRQEGLLGEEEAAALFDPVRMAQP